MSRRCRRARRCRRTMTCCRPCCWQPNRCATSCPPRRSFVASDARRRGQLCAASPCRQSTYLSKKSVQTTGATSLFLSNHKGIFEKFLTNRRECDGVASLVLADDSRGGLTALHLSARSAGTKWALEFLPTGEHSAGEAEAAGPRSGAGNCWLARCEVAHHRLVSHRGVCAIDGTERLAFRSALL